MPSKLHEKAAKVLKEGPDGSDPSQLGDPITLKAEQNGNVSKPKDEGNKLLSFEQTPNIMKSGEEWSKPDSSKPPASGNTPASAHPSDPGYNSDVKATGPGKKGNPTGKGRDGEETLRQKAMKKLHGQGANPSQLGDPISLKAEQSETVPKPEEEGASGLRHSKL